MIRVLLVGAMLVAPFSDAFAQDRRRGVQGAFTSRAITLPRNNLSILAGPVTASTFGQRYRSVPTEGGLQLLDPNFRRTLGSGDPDTLLGANLGVMFGIWENIEAGALFIPLQFSPDFEFETITVALTYAFYGLLGDNVDAAFRLGFEVGDWNLNLGLPVLIRSGNLRIDTGVFLPVRFADDVFEDGTRLGLNVPVRATVNLNPKLFVGLETGFFEPAFGEDDEPMAIPLGAVVGYSLVSGARVIDFTANFAWDNFVVLDRDPFETTQFEFFRLTFGVVLNQQVM